MVWIENDTTDIILILFQLPSEIICILNSKRIPLESLSYISCPYG